MKKIAVIYKSRYGTTKRYAEWIAEALDAPIYECGEIKPSQLSDYDLVVYGGGLYAGGIDGVKLVAGELCPRLVLFTVGLADPQITDFTPFLKKAFAPEQLAKTKVFHFRGGIDYKKLSLVHKGMMAMVKRSAEKLPAEERNSDDMGIIDTYGKQVDFTDKAAIAPLVEYAKTL